MENGLSIWVNPLTAWMLQGGDSPMSYGTKASAFGFMLRFDSSLRPFEIREPRWEFPRERFVSYEKGDESWCRYFGIGHLEPAKIVDGEIVLRQDVAPQYVQFDPFRRAVCIDESQLFYASRAVEVIKKKCRSFLSKELRCGL